MTFISWLGIVFCISQSALFSGSNLAFFSISKLRLEVEVAQKNPNAEKMLALRQDANFLLTTILWGNVGINVLLTLISNSVMAGLSAFLFSTVVITFVGEIIPQAYFSRHAIKSAAVLAPIIKIYQAILYPVAKPCAWVLDRWLGREGIHYFREEDLRHVIKMHMDSEDADVNAVEGEGALNFLSLDDLLVTQEGEPVDPQSIIPIQNDGQGNIVFPQFEPSQDDPFLKAVEISGKKWAILADRQNFPRMVLDADGFLRSALFRKTACKPLVFCHRPVTVTDLKVTLGDVIQQLKAPTTSPHDDVVDHDIILVWTDEIKRVITGADILGRLLRGIATGTRASDRN
jgi:metal transporter CNNM